MKKLLSFIMRLGEDICQAKYEQVATMFGTYKISTAQKTEVDAD